MAQQPRTRFRAKRIYDAPDADDGRRVLVDRLWPRGISKQQAAIDEWAKDVAPSAELRRWLHDDPEHRESEFRRRYRAELTDDEHTAALERLRGPAEQGSVTLLTSARDLTRGHVPILLAALQQ